MSRLQKKCFIGATSLHCLLMLALAVGPGFFNKESEESLNVITFEPGILTDEKISGGGSPRQATPPQQPATPPTPTPPQPVAPPQTQAERVERVETVKPELEKVRRNDPDVVETKPEKTQTREVQISKKVVRLNKPNTQATSRNTSNTSSNSKANDALQKAIAQAGNNISSGIASSAKISMSDGPGGGGVSYANYAQEIQRRYKAAYDRALQAAGDIADRPTSVETSVVILSNGTVVTSTILKTSGNTALDSLTRRVLDSIREVPPFPVGAKDSRRTFNIIFDLKPRNSLG